MQFVSESIWYCVESPGRCKRDERVPSFFREKYEFNILRELDGSDLAF